MTGIKICGINTAEALEAAVDAGAEYLGFVFHPSSPRAIDAETARYLTNKTPTTVMNIGLFVDPSPAEITKILECADLDMLQLHGNETPEQVQAIRSQCGLPVMKAIRVSSKADLEYVPAYEKVCDWLLFDTKSDKAMGGSGESFDWNLLSGMFFLKPWMLAGGLNADNVTQALAALSPKAVDVSSGVEDAPGVKSPAKIKNFIETVRAAR